MGYTTFQQAKAFVEPGYGTCEPVKLAKAVNAIRGHFFNWYQELALFLDAVECFRVHRFFADCNDCNSSFLGVTLPRDFQTVEAMWYNDFPLRLQSSWREFHTGISPECDCRLQKFDIPGTFTTAVDLDSKVPKRVGVKALEAADEGKRFVIRGVAGTGQPYTHEFTLSTDLQETPSPMRSIDRAGGIIKAQTVGRVLLVNETGELLSIYEPDETVPGYRRIKITGLRDGCETVNIRAARRFFPLFGDDDVVETDNERAWDAMARYLRLYERTDKTSDTLRAEKDHFQTAFKMMTGEKSRDIGRGTEGSVTIVTPSFGGAQQLNRIGRFRRW